MRCIEIFIIQAVLMCLAGAAHAQRVTVSETIEKYQIHGKTADDLLREMQVKGPPPAFGGPRYFARAEPYFNWDFSLSREGGACAVDEFDVGVTIHYTLPEWVERESGGKRLVAYWDAFLEALWIHERGHGDVAIEDGRDVAAALAVLVPQDNCEALLAESNRAATAVLKSSTRQKDYDRETNHGRKQGAYFVVADATRRR